MELDASRLTLGTSVSAQLVASPFVLLFSRWLFKRCGPRYIFIIGLLIYSLRFLGKPNKAHARITEGKIFPSSFYPRIYIYTHISVIVASDASCLSLTKVNAHAFFKQPISRPKELKDKGSNIQGIICSGFLKLCINFRKIDRRRHAVHNCCNLF